MPNWKVSRRFFLASSGAVLALPTLEAFFSKRALADGSSDPRRLVAMYMTLGTYNIAGDYVWYPPTGPITAATLPPVLSPFAANVGDFSIVQTLGCRAFDSNPAGQHGAAVSSYFGQVPANVGAATSTLAGDTLDWMVAKKANKNVLVVSGGCGGGPGDGVGFAYGDSISFQKVKDTDSYATQTKPYANPVALFDIMFSKLAPSTGPSTSARIAANSSIADVVHKDIAELQSKLGKTDSRKLDEYLTTLQGVERSLTSSGGTSSVCAPGTRPPADEDNVDNFGTQQNYLQRMKAFADMIVLAFQCDLVRSVVWMYDSESTPTSFRNYSSQIPSSLVFQNVSMNCDEHLELSHYDQAGGGRTEGRARCITRDRLRVQMMMDIVNRLKQSTDPSGSPMLDNSMLVNGYGVPQGQHSVVDAGGMPMIVAGGKNFAHPGNSIDAAGKFDRNDLWYTVSTYFGLGLKDYYGGNKLVPL